MENQCTGLQTFLITVRVDRCCQVGGCYGREPWRKGPMASASGGSSQTLVWICVWLDFQDAAPRDLLFGEINYPLGLPLRRVPRRDGIEGTWVLHHHHTGLIQGTACPKQCPGTSGTTRKRDFSFVKGKRQYTPSTENVNPVTRK